MPEYNRFIHSKNCLHCISVDIQFSFSLSSHSSTPLANPSPHVLLSIAPSPPHPFPYLGCTAQEEWHTFFVPLRIVYTAPLPRSDAAHWDQQMSIEYVVEWVTGWKGADEEARAGWLGIKNAGGEYLQTS